MKKVIFTFLSAAFMSASFAQYCGNSGTSVCTPSGTLTEPGLSPASDSLPSIVNGTAPNTVIQFKNFNQFNFGGQTVTVQTLKIDTLSNLPSGTCWATNKSNNTWANQEDGCIKVSGTVCSDPGQYRLYIVVTANIGVPIQTNADAAGLKYFVRVKNQGDSEVAVDTNQTASFAKLSGYSATANCGVGINEVSSVKDLSIVPNPMNSQATVKFFAEKAGVYTQKITNMLGSEVSRTETEVQAGEFTTIIERNNMPAGVYFYTVTDGKNSVTKRFSITE